jgi:hypothetical protein
LGIAYDVTGHGTTAIKMSLGRYLEGARRERGSTATRTPRSGCRKTTMVFGTAGVTRAWSDANGNFVADCDLASPAAQDLRASGGDLCGSFRT